MPDVLDGDPVVVNHLMTYIHERVNLGVRRYGRPLQTHNGRVALADALSEQVDFLLYFVQHIIEQDGCLPSGDEEDDQEDEIRRLKKALGDLTKANKLLSRRDQRRRTELNQLNLKLGEQKPLVRERQGLEQALRNLIQSLDARALMFRRTGDASALTENEVVIEALIGILGNPTAALQS